MFIYVHPTIVCVKKSSLFNSVSQSISSSSELIHLPLLIYKTHTYYVIDSDLGLTTFTLSSWLSNLVIKDFFRLLPKKYPEQALTEPFDVIWLYQPDQPELGESRGFSSTRVSSTGLSVPPLTLQRVATCTVEKFLKKCDACHRTCTRRQMFLLWQNSDFDNVTKNSVLFLKKPLVTPFFEFARFKFFLELGGMKFKRKPESNASARKR